MASMIFASSPLSVQSFVKLRTNSNYSHSPCNVSRVKNSYIHLPYKNISNIQSSKSLFTKGDDSFFFSSQKFPRVASKYSPSLNIIKATSQSDNIYEFHAHDVKTGKKVQLGQTYRREILLIVNLPQKYSYKVEEELKFLNGLRNRYKDQTSAYGGGFEVLGFFPHLETSLFPPRWKEKYDEEKIQKLAEFRIFRKGGHRDENDCKFWNFLRNAKEGETTEEEEFEKYLVNGTGECVKHFPWFEGETLKDSEDPKSGESSGNIPRSGESPGNIFRPGFEENPRYDVEDAIAGYFKRRDYSEILNKLHSS